MLPKGKKRLFIRHTCGQALCSLLWELIKISRKITWGPYFLSFYHADISDLLSSTQPSVSPTFAMNTSSANTIKPTSTTTATTRPTTRSTTTTTPTTTASVTLTKEPEVTNCPDNHCENDGVCIIVERSPVCRYLLLVTLNCNFRMSSKSFW